MDKKNIFTNIKICSYETVPFIAQYRDHYIKTSWFRTTIIFAKPISKAGKGYHFGGLNEEAYTFLTELCPDIEIKGVNASRLYLEFNTQTIDDANCIITSFKLST